MDGFTRRRVLAGGAAIAGSIALPARAAGYPERDITYINPWSAAGSVDVMSRQYAKQMEKLLNANINIENRLGGSGTIGVGMVIRAKPDGYTIGYAGNGTLAYQPLVLKGLAWSKPDDFQPLVKLNQMPTLLVVKADSPLKNWDDFMRAVRSQPNQIRVAVAALRTSADLEMQQVNRLANVKIRTVPFNGGDSIIALLGGRVECLASYTEAIRGHVDAGAMRVIAVFKKGVYEPFPQATPVGDLNIVDTMLPSCNYVIGPKGMPKDVLDKLVGASKSVVNSDEFKTFLKRGGMDWDPMGPEEIRAELVRVVATYTSLIQFLDLAEKKA